MIYIAVCDDDEYFLLQEKKIINKYMKKTKYSYKIDTFTSGLELVQMREGITKYDIIFLDIGMKNMDGMSTAGYVRRYTKNAYIVFVTAFISYSLEGYKVNAIRYILKDNHNIEISINESMDAIIDKMDYAEQSYTFDFQGGQKTIPLEAIIYIESKLHKLEFHLIGDEDNLYTMYGRLDHVAEELQDFPFSRVHKSYLANLQHMDKIERYHATLSNGDIINISQSRYREVKEEFIRYLGE